MAAPRPIPGASAASDLGLGGQLSEQVAGETEEERKKRMAQMSQMQKLGPGGSLAAGALFGGMGGQGY